MSPENDTVLERYFTECLKKAFAHPIKERDFDALRAQKYERGGDKRICPPYQVETTSPDEYKTLLKVTNDMYPMPEGWIEEQYEHELEHYFETEEQYSDPEYKLQNFLGVRFIDYGGGNIGIQPVHTFMVGFIDDEATIKKKLDAISRKPKRLSRSDLLDLGDPNADGITEDQWY